MEKTAFDFYGLINPTKHTAWAVGMEHNERAKGVWMTETGTWNPSLMEVIWWTETGEANVSFRYPDKTKTITLVAGKGDLIVFKQSLWYKTDVTRAPRISWQVRFAKRNDRAVFPMQYNVRPEDRDSENRGSVKPLANETPHQRPRVEAHRSRSPRSPRRRLQVTKRPRD